METIKLREEYIKLGQALKAAGLAESGVDCQVCHTGWTGESQWPDRTAAW